MLTRSPLKVLLADPDYNQYLMLKHILQNKCNHYCKLFWCGNRIQYQYALDSGVYDLAMINASGDSLDSLKIYQSNCRHTPVVLMVDEVTRKDAISASQIGVLGILDKHHMDELSLACYLVCAELFHKGELAEGFIADIAILGKHKKLQHPYTYIH